MNRPARSLLLIALVFLSGVNASSGEASPAVEWVTGIEAAFQSAAESGRPLLVDFWAIWCEPCKLMEETTYRDERVLRAMEGFVPLKVDVDTNEVFVERYRVDGFPTTLFLDAEGRELMREVSLVQADGMLEIMAGVAKGYDSYLANVARTEDRAALEAVADYLLRLGNADRAVDTLRAASKAAKAEGAAEDGPLELAIAEALLAGGRTATAAKSLRKLSQSSEPGVRGPALALLVRAERERGREAKADEALAQLRADFPDIAAKIE